MKRFNLSEWALEYQSLVLYAMIVLAIFGVLAYSKLGQSEDPPFTFKVMVIRTNWPGATAHEVEEQITDRIEKKLQEAPHVDVIRSYSKPGESLVFFAIKDSTPTAAIAATWDRVRKKVGDMRHTLPAGIQGPYFNDEFGETFGNIYALTGDGFAYADLKKYADRIRRELLRVPDVAKVELIGEQDEKVFIELSNTKLATLGVDVQTIVSALATQNAMAPAGSFETASDKIYLRPSGDFASVEAIRETTIRANGRLFRLGDIAKVSRGYADPPQPKMRFLGKEALGIGVSMAKGGDIIELGQNLDRTVERLRKELPVGLELGQVTSQPEAVKRSVGEFVRSLTEAVLIVLAVSLASLGLRTGIVVALSIPLVLAATFLFMQLFGIGLHKISLGALILALGLLVDNAIIAVEMMATKMEQGWDRLRAASFAYTSTAMPMLTGTLVTVAGFLPIATAASSTGEYTRSIFQVTTIALLVSWIAAVVFVPYLGYRLLPDAASLHGKPSRLARLLRRIAPRLAALLERAPLPHAAGAPADRERAIYATPFYARFRATVHWCVGHRKTVIAATAALFAAALLGFGLVQQQFFPASSRPELLVDLRLAEGSSFAATEAAAKQFEKTLQQESGIVNYVSYVGWGSPRFYLPLDQQLANANFAQFVILTQDLKAREALRARLIRRFETDFHGVRGTVTRLENGPPVGFPVQFRVSGEDIATVRRHAEQVADVMRGNPHVSNVHFDWEERSKVIKVEIDQEKARLLGLSSQDLSAFLNTSLNGLTVTYYRERDKQVEVLLRGSADERARLSLVADLAVPIRSGAAGEGKASPAPQRSVPLAQLATISYGFEDGVIWRRNGLPTITARATVYGDIQGPAVTAQIAPLLAPIRAALPAGYILETGGAVEDSAKGQKSVMAGLPLLALVVLTVLMLQLQSFSRVAMVVLTAPLGLIGVTAAMLVFNQPFGFVAMLGTIALSGMIMRNSVILVDQIDQDIRAGHAPWEAIVEATVRRFRPITLTAAAAVLAMIPLTRSAFFGPMAVAIMGGLVVATLLTLLFLPALYAAWFRVKAPAPARPRTPAAPRPAPAGAPAGMLEGTR
ncbi:MAG TPA: efflux RND transporter permease subunit [Burkholderiales bacterium]|nr:efflux RND transporter permease subunit [Burkholderiales bacterium]